MAADLDCSIVTVNIEFGCDMDHVMLQDCFMMDMVVDANWTGEDEPVLWEDWKDGSNFPAISGVQEIVVPYDLFGEWGPENDNGGIDEAEDDQTGVSDPALANSFSEGAVYPAGRIGGPSMDVWCDRRKL